MVYTSSGNVLRIFLVALASLKQLALASTGAHLVYVCRTYTTLVNPKKLLLAEPLGVEVTLRGNFTRYGLACR